MTDGASIKEPTLPSALRAIVSDLDGTLLRSDGTMSTYSVSMLHHLHQSGYLVTFATARPRFVASQLLSTLPFLAPVIYSNGAVVSDTRGGRAIRRRTIGRQLATRIIDSIRSEFPVATIAIDYVGDRAVDPNWQPLGNRPIGSSPLWPLDGASIHGRPIYCIMVADGWTEPSEVPDEWPVSSTSSSRGLIELSARGADKLSALNWLCRVNNLILQEVIAFGDMPNDLDMLTGVGLGVAMANAHPDVKLAADALTVSNNEDGVARFLESIMCTMDCRDSVRHPTLTHARVTTDYKPDQYGEQSPPTRAQHATMTS